MSNHRYSPEFKDEAVRQIIEGMGHDLPPQLIDKLTTIIANHAQGYAP